jgi:LAO/AO transport system kinase
VSELADALIGGDRRALARAITLAESTHEADREAALELVQRALPAAGGALRLGVSGAPGAGKSTMIEAIGVRLADAGARVGVLTVDPTSARSGGSVLGDKTRMEDLSRRDNAFIRPSPSGGTLGGVARRTREAMLLVEAWGADVVMIETVGVGQSEVAVAGMVDQFLLVISPGGGDELQGIKRGVMELADVIVVNKADGELAAAAERSRAEYAAAAHLMRPRHTGLPTPVVAASALEGTGLDELWQAIEQRHRALDADGRLARLRSAQASDWLWSEVREGLLAALDQDPRAAAIAKRREAEVADGRAFPPLVAREIVEALLDGR